MSHFIYNIRLYHKELCDKAQALDGFAGDNCNSYSRRTVIYNRISSLSGKSIYPDIVFSHPFYEDSITDDEIFEEVSGLIKEYGSSRIVVVLPSSDEDLRYLDEIMTGLFPCNDDIQTGLCCSLIHNTEYLQSFNDMSDALMLSHTMRIDFARLMDYYIETGNNPDDLFSPFIKEYALPVSCRKEGKKIYELIRNKVLG